MADINDPELSRAIEELTRTLNGLGSSADTGSAKFRAAGDQLFKVKGSGEALEKTLNGLSKSVTDLSKSIYKGEKGATQYADAAESAADSMGEFASKFGVMGKVLGATLSIGVKYFAAAGRQADKLYKGFQDLSKVGAATAGGMADVRESLRDFRLGIDEIDKLVALVGANAQNLTLFGSNVARGAKSVGQLARGITGDDGVLQRFMNMGETVDTINESAFAYAAMQARMGVSQQRLNEKGSKALEEYIEKQNILTKVTGMQAQEQQAAQARAMNIEQFRAKNMELMASNDANQIAQAERMMDTFKNLSALDPSGQLAEMFAVLQTGFVAPGSGLTATILSNADAMRIATDTTMDSNRQAEAFAKSIGAMSKPGGVFFDLARFGMFKQITGADFGALQDAMLRTDEFASRMANAKDETERQQIRQEAATKAMGALQIANMSARDSMQDFVGKGIGPATIATSAFATALKGILGLLPFGLGDRAIKAAEEKAKGGVAPGTSATGLMGAAAKNLNPGNLRFAGQKGAKQGTGGFAAFQSVDEGLVALANQLNLYLTGKSAMGKRDTIASIVSAYAPSNENDTAQYIKQVAAFMGLDPNAKLPGDPATLAKLMVAIVGKESMGGLEKGYGMRGGIQYAVAQVLGVDPSQIGQFANGGISRGPNSGYAAVLHGSEAVVPLPDGNSIPVEIKGLGADQLVQQLGGYLAKANMLYRETLPGAGISRTTSPEFMAAVMKIYDMAAERAAEAQLRGIDYVKRLELSGSLGREGIMKELAEGGVTTGPSIAGERGPEAVVPLPDGRTIPVTMTGLGEGIAEMISLLRTNNDISQKILQMSSS